jgi:TetR/AcrR family transcriptional regulator, lmrAB and yxaGH operons repressor
LGGSRARFHRRLNEIFEAWISALARLAQDAGVPAKTARERAEDAVLRIQGALILAGELDDTAPFRRTIKTLGKEFLA